MQTVLDKMVRAGLDGDARKVQAYGPDGAAMRGVFGIGDTYGRNTFPGVAVGSRYTVLTNRELATIADEASRALGLRTDPSVSAWDGGARVSVLLPISEFGVGIGRQDTTAVRLRIDNVHGHGGIGVAIDMLRLVCSNGMVRRVGGSKTIIRHTLTVERKVRAVVLQAAGARSLIEREAVTAQRLADRALSQEELRRFFLAVHEAAYGALPEDGTRARATAIERVSSWVRNLEDERQLVGGIQGTAWAALQSVIQWADHEAPARSPVARATSADHGALAVVKRRARDVAESLLTGVVLG